MADTDKTLDVLRQGTPGPWTVREEYNEVRDGWLILAGGNEVALACYFGGTDPAKANARRIAANPLLVEVFAAAVRARSLESAADFKNLEAWHAEATNRYAALDAAIAAVVKEVNNG